MYGILNQEQQNIPARLSSTLESFKKIQYNQHHIKKEGIENFLYCGLLKKKFLRGVVLFLHMNFEICNGE